MKCIVNTHLINTEGCGRSSLSLRTSCTPTQGLWLEWFHSRLYRSLTDRGRQCWLGWWLALLAFHSGVHIHRLRRAGCTIWHKTEKSTSWVNSGQLKHPYIVHSSISCVTYWVPTRTKHQKPRYKLSTFYRSTLWLWLVVSILSNTVTWYIQVQIAWVPGIQKKVYNGSPRSEEHTSELQSPVPISYAVFCLKKKKKKKDSNMNKDD